MENFEYSKFGYKLWFLIRPIFRLIFRISAEGIENVPREGGCILAANHRSNLDPFVLNTISPRPIFFMAKHELFKIPILSWIIRKAGAIPVKRTTRDIGALKKAIELVNNGYCIGIFPEGTRAKPGQFRKPRVVLDFLYPKHQEKLSPLE
ncbi:lysophospholipid acyltransferase family protein [Persephonella sp. KM09-Lau-8]|uniref:lysophospholipid acyltransferase family protein n=1 Tax=Persephonella sp. KM09-Lau-8 TaxID=1158345 RepID=UPI000A5A80D1|nr:lysophospholipid acyltransferase family protein [Persephonella sp. KM09-Lau-8]